MNHLLALICLVAGVVILIWNRKLSRAYLEFMFKYMTKFYESIGYKLPGDRLNSFQYAWYQIGTIGVGLAFLAFAYVLAFGTINLG